MSPLASQINLILKLSEKMDFDWRYIIFSKNISRLLRKNLKNRTIKITYIYRRITKLNKIDD